MLLTSIIDILVSANKTGYGLRTERRGNCRLSCLFPDSAASLVKVEFEFQPLSEENCRRTMVSGVGESRAIDLAELEALTKLHGNARGWGIPNDELSAIRTRLDYYIERVEAWNR